MASVLLSSTASFLYRGINTTCPLLAWKSASVRVSGRASRAINNAGNPSRSGIDVVRNKIKMFAQQKVSLSSPDSIKNKTFLLRVKLILTLATRHLWRVSPLLACLSDGCLRSASLLIFFFYSRA